MIDRNPEVNVAGRIELQHLINTIRGDLFSHVRKRAAITNDGERRLIGLIEPEEFLCTDSE